MQMNRLVLVDESPVSHLGVDKLLSAARVANLGGGGADEQVGFG